MLQRQSLSYTILSIALDAFAVILALALADYFRNTLDVGRPFGWQQFLPLPVYGIALIAWMLSFSFFSVYDPQMLYSPFQELRRVMLSSGVQLLLLTGMLYFSYRDISRLLVVYFFVIHLATVLGWRVTFSSTAGLIQRYNKPVRRVVIIGDQQLAYEVIQTMGHYNWADFHLVGVIYDSTIPPDHHIPILGRISQSADLIAEHQIDEVILALPSQDHSILSQLVYDLQKMPIRIHVLPDYLKLALYRARVEDFGGLPLIQLRAPALTAEQRLMKRVFDMGMGAILASLAAPLMMVIAIAIKLDSRGGIFFKQERVGENGVIFSMYKFRTMYTDAEQRRIIRYRPDGVANHKVPDDPRVTGVGAILRRTSLDELPQLLNVLRGQMSLVGPRPEMPWLVDQYAPWQRTRFAVPQGITGWWQVNNRHDQPMAQHTEDDLYYIQHYSIWLDLWILLRTIGAVIRQRGAY